MTIIGDTFSVEERAKMQAYFSGVWGLSSIVGPVVGGFITDQISWRWVFWVNLPIGVLAALIIGLALKEPKRTSKPTVDYVGAALLMIAVSVLMLAMVENGSASFLGAQNIMLLALAAVLLGIFYWVEKRAKDPVIPFDLFRNRTIAIGVGCGFLAGIAMFGAISFVPLFAQGVLGFSATQAGSLLTPLMLSWVSMSIVGGRLMLKVSTRSITIVGFAVLTLGFVLLSLFGTDSATHWLYFDLVIVGAGLGLTMLTLLIAVQQAVERSQLGVATSLNQFSRAIGGALGVAILGAVLTAGLGYQLRAAAASGSGVLTAQQAEEFASNPNALIAPDQQSQISEVQLHALRTSMEKAIRPVFLVGAVMSLLAFFVSMLLPKHLRTGNEDIDGERMLMAEQTTINARNQPLTIKD
jgi:EmrB/QacA subfamily drug resistance transporter